MPVIIYLIFHYSLQGLSDEEWGDRVTIVSCDMRDWNAPEKADILVSELLGSFGDNELSPECLDGAQKFLKGKKSVVRLLHPFHLRSFEMFLNR